MSFPFFGGAGDGNFLNHVLHDADVLHGYSGDDDPIAPVPVGVPLGKWDPQNCHCLECPPVNYHKP